MTSSVLHYVDRYYTTAIMVTQVFFKILPAARLPFKRLNPEPKENQPPKRPCAHACPEPGVSDRDNENESESSALPVHSGPPLVNGRGPLDGFLSRRRPAPSDENMVIDLTADNSLSPAKRHVLPASASPCLPTKDKHQSKDKTSSSGKPSNVDHTPKTHTLDSEVVNTDEDEEVEEEDGDQTASISQLDTTQDSESEPEEPEEHDESGNVSSLGNRSMLSASSVSSTSESSPEKSRTDDPTPTTTPTVCSSPIACFLFNLT